LSSGTVGILGLAYKPDTGVIEQSQGVAVAKRLYDEGYSVVAYDPKAVLPVDALSSRFTAAPDARTCLASAQLALVMTPWPEFATLPADAFERGDRRMIVVDCWRALSPEVATVADVVYLGKGEQALATSVV
jgi:UDPglucose 6-dehydrogenase